MHATLPTRLRLPARLENLPRLRELALEAAAALGLGPEWIGKVDLALEEAVVNIARHAYKAPPGEEGPGDVELSCEALPGGEGGGGGLRLVLSDWGAPFDPLDMPDASLEASLEANLEADLDHRAPGGMGLFLIRSLARASYRREDGANRLILDFGD